MKNEEISSRYIYVAASFGAIPIVLVLILYFLNFHNGLSPSSADWANFGSFFSGIVSPVLAYGSFVGLLMTISLAMKQLNIAVNQRKLDTYVNMAIKCEEEIATKQNFIPIMMQKVMRGIYPRDEFRVLQLSNLYRLLFEWLYSINKYDESHPLIFQFVKKHGGVIRKLNKLGWLDTEISDFFSRKEGDFSVLKYSRQPPSAQ